MDRKQTAYVFCDKNYDAKLSERIGYELEHHITQNVIIILKIKLNFFIKKETNTIKIKNTFRKNKFIFSNKTS